MLTTRKLLRELESSRIVRPQQGASLREVGNIQSLLGVSFPRVYTEFLRACGVLKVYDRTVFGLGPSTQRLYGLTESTLFHTLYHRRVHGLPTPFVVVWHDSHQDCQCLDLRRIHNGDCPVILYDPNAKGTRKIRDVAPTFSAWLRHIVDKQLAVKKLLDAEMPGKLTAMGEFRPRRRRAKKKAKARSARRSASRH